MTIKTPTTAGFLTFLRSDPEQVIDHASFETCGVGDYFRHIGVEKNDSELYHWWIGHDAPFASRDHDTYGSFAKALDGAIERGTIREQSL